MKIHFLKLTKCNFYEKRKRQSTIASMKPHVIASIHRLIQTMYTPLHITSFTIILLPNIDKAVYAVLL